MKKKSTSSSSSSQLVVGLTHEAMDENRAAKAQTPHHTTPTTPHLILSKVPVVVELKLICSVVWEARAALLALRRLRIVHQRNVPVFATPDASRQERGTEVRGRGEKARERESVCVCVVNGRFKNRQHNRCRRRAHTHTHTHTC